MADILQFPTIKVLLRKQAKKVINKLSNDSCYGDELSIKLLELQKLMNDNN